MVKNIVGRHARKKEIFYEIEWEGLDAKQNTHEPLSKLRLLGVETFARAFDERQAAAAAGVDQRPLSEREIVNHLAQFDIDKNLATERLIESMSAGQKSRLTLAGAFWTKPHIICLDEPTNYLDMDTVDQLSKSLSLFKGAVVVVTHHQKFMVGLLTEKW